MTMRDISEEITKLEDELHEAQVQNADLRVEIERLLDSREAEREKVAALSKESEDLYESVERLEDQLTEAHEPDAVIEAAFSKIMAGIGEVLPEGEDVANESIGRFNLRRGLEDLAYALDPLAKNRWPWGRRS